MTIDPAIGSAADTAAVVLVWSAIGLLLVRRATDRIPCATGRVARGNNRGDLEVHHASSLVWATLPPACGSQSAKGMHSIEPARWDDYVLATLLLLIGVPRVILAALYDRPLGVEGTLSILCVALALLVLFRRRR